MKSVTVLVTFLLLSAFAHASGDNKENKTESEKHTIEGKVIDQTNGDELTGVRVQIEGTDLVTYTDRYGNFTFENLPCTECQVQFSYISFEERELTVSEVSSQNKVALTSR